MFLYEQHAYQLATTLNSVQFLSCVPIGHNLEFNPIVACYYGFYSWLIRVFVRLSVCVFARQKSTAFRRLQRAVPVRQHCKVREMSSGATIIRSQGGFA